MILYNLRPLSLNEYDSISTKYEFFNFKDTKVKPSIDYVKLRINFTEYSPSAVKKLLQLYSQGIKLKFKNINISLYKATIIFECKNFIVLYWIIPSYGLTLIKFLNPTSNFLKLMEDVFSCINYDLSEVEYSLDFYNDNTRELFCFFTSHACLNRAGTLFNVYYDTTQYLNNIRKNKKFGSRIYIKNDVDEFLRLEMVVKQRALKKIGLFSITDAMNINANTVFHKLEFKYIDHDNFFKNVKKNLFNKNYNSKQFEKAFIASMNGSKDCGGLTALKKFINTLKNNPHNYFKKHEFSDLLFERLVEVRFNHF